MKFLKKKDKGMIEYTIGLMMISLAFILVIRVYYMKMIDVTKTNVEDSLVMANLACATIDKAPYMDDKTISLQNIDDPIGIYNLYVKVLKENMKLRDDLYPKNDTVITSNVVIDELRLYVVNNSTGNIDVVTITNNGASVQKTSVRNTGNVKTPNGKVIESASVYSKISFDVKGVYNSGTIRVSKDNAVDVVSNI